MAKDYSAQLIEMAQPHCDGAVVAAAGVMPRGVMGGMLLRKLSPAAGWARKRQARSENPDFPRSALMAVTDRYVYILTTEVRGRTSVVTGVFKQWDRNAVTATTTRGATTVGFDLTVPTTGDHYTLEAITLAGGATSAQALAAALATR